MIASDRQHTLANEIVLEGIGLHTGENAQLRIAAGDINTGYVFVRKDLEENLKFRRTFRTCQKRGVAQHCGSGEAVVHTTEHVLASLYAMGIDNARLELTGPEVPILDGSASPFVEAILAAKSTEQDAPRRFFKVHKNISYKAEGASRCSWFLTKETPSRPQSWWTTKVQCWERNMPAWSSLRTFKKKLQVAERLSS